MLFNFFKTSRVNVPVTGCRTIHTIKKYDKKSMRALQRICFPQIHPVTLSAEIIIHEVDSVLTQADRIISDCKEIICDTENPKIFFERYSLLIEKYTYMAKFEPYVEIYG